MSTQKNSVRDNALLIVSDYMVRVIGRGYAGIEKKIGISICQELYSRIYKNEEAPLIIIENYADDLEVHSHRCGFESKIIFRIGKEITDSLIKSMS